MAAIAVAIIAGALLLNYATRDDPQTSTPSADPGLSTTSTTEPAVDWNSRYNGAIPVHDISERGGSWLVVETNLHDSVDGNQVYGMAAQVCFDALSMGWSGRIQVLDAENRRIAETTTMPNGNVTCAGSR